MSNIAVVTTFSNSSWDIYSKRMLQSYTEYWPADVPLMVQLDDDLLVEQVQNHIRPQDAIAVGWEPEHADFVKRNAGKDSADNYRHQPVHFCHKVFAIKRALDAAIKFKNSGGNSPRYLIWLDADVLTATTVTHELLKECLPNEGDTVAYMGRKDWGHSECGWLAFDLQNRGEEFIEVWVGQYTSDNILKMQEQHDSWAFDLVRKSKDAPPCTNLTAGQPGMDIWKRSPMAKFSVHYKGPQAKQELAMQAKPSMGDRQQNIIINTQNALPDKELQAHIRANQKLITNWVQACHANDEEVIIASAGPMLIAEDLRQAVADGKKIVAVKHALRPLEAAGITPWACILLDPRPHVTDFVDKPNKDVIWFVASQVNPAVTRKLLKADCTVWGYHASIRAGEGHLTSQQPSAVIHGGSATATRGLFMLAHLGFRKFKLYGYDLCFPDKPDLNAKDERGQPKFLEIFIGSDNPLFAIKRGFWTEPQLIAQFEEMNDLIKSKRFSIDAVGEGIIPFLVKIQNVTDLRQNDLKSKIGHRKLSSYRKLIKWNPKSRPWTLANLLYKARNRKKTMPLTKPRKA